MINPLSFRKKFTNIVKKSDNIIITSHYSPDDDAIASALVTHHWINQKYPSKKVQVIITGNPDRRYQSFSGYGDIKFVPDMSSELGKSDLLIMVDGSQYTRFSRQSDQISQHSCLKICIDHHSSPVDKFDLIYLDKHATSSTEIVFDVLYPKVKLSPDIAKVFLLGIFGDTGTFNYLKTNQLNTFDNVKKIMKVANVEIQAFKATYSTISQPVFSIIQEYIRNTTFIELPQGNSYQYSFITKKFIEQYGYSDGQTSEAGSVYMAQYLRLISGYRWGFIATPKRDEVSVSFRSLPGSVNVRKIVEDLGIGGGHDRAAGSGFKPDRWGKKLSINFCIDFLIEWLSSHKLELS